ncbi:hypothetical protein QEN19_002352 [Hanseniaspora menglaensis]
MPQNDSLYDDFEDQDNPFVNPFDDNADEEDNILAQHTPDFIKNGGLPFKENFKSENKVEDILVPEATTESIQTIKSSPETVDEEGNEDDEESAKITKNRAEYVSDFDTDDRLNHLRKQNVQFLEKYDLIVTVINVCRQLPDGRILSSNSYQSGEANGSQNKKFESQQRSLNNFRAGDVILYLSINTNLPTFRKKANKNVIKSYKEFENFAIYLQDFRINNFHEFFPPAIPLNKTSYGLNNTEDLIQCKINFQKWFDNRIVKNVSIMRLEELSIFLESDFNSYIPMNGSINTSNNTTTSMTSANHSKDSMNSNDTMVSPSEQLKRKTLKQLQPPFDPIEELAVFRPMIKTWRKDLQMLQTNLFKYCKYKQQLSTQETNLGKQFITISNSTDMIVNSENKFKVNSDSNNFHNMYKRVGKTLQTIGDLNSIMATFDMAAMYDDLEWCGRDLYNVKEQLTNRHFLMRELKNVSQEVEKNEQNLKKLKTKREIDPLKIHDIVKNLQKQRELQSFYRSKLEKISNSLLLDKENIMKTWEEDTISTFKNFALRNIEYERKKLTVLGRVKNDVRRTDKIGGLSRLGRKNLKPYNEDVKDTEIEADEDSWSGNKRASHADEESEMKGTLFKTAQRLSDLTRPKEGDNKLAHEAENAAINSTGFDEETNYFANLAAKRYAANAIGRSDI